MGTFCPLIKKECVEHKCKFYVHLLGKNPQSSGVIDNWDCAISFLPVLLIEGAQQTRQAGAAIESFRNELVLGLQQTQRAIALRGNGEDYNTPK